MDPINLIARGLLPIFCRILSKLDEQAFSLLAPHKDKIIALKIKNFSEMYFQVNTNGLNVLTKLEDETKVNTSIEGEVAGLINLLLSPDKINIDNSFKISGDMELAQALFATLRHIDIDWEEQLVKVFGEPVGIAMAQFSNQSSQWLKDNIARRKEDLATYLQEEIKLLPSQTEIEDFYTEVSLLRDDVERFAARINILSEQCNPKPH